MVRNLECRHMRPASTYIFFLDAFVVIELRVTFSKAKRFQLHHAVSTKKLHSTLGLPCQGKSKALFKLLPLSQNFKKFYAQFDDCKHRCCIANIRNARFLVPMVPQNELEK